MLLAMHDLFFVMWSIDNSSPQKADIFLTGNSINEIHLKIDEIHLKHVVIILKIHLFNCRQVLIDIFVNICRLSKQLDDLANADSSLFSDEQKVC